MVSARRPAVGALSKGAHPPGLPKGSAAGPPCPAPADEAPPLTPAEGEAPPAAGVAGPVDDLPGTPTEGPPDAGSAPCGAPPPPHETATGPRPTYRGLHNPMDICVSMMAATLPAPLSLQALEKRMPAFWTSAIVREAVLNLQSLGALLLDEINGDIQLVGPIPDCAPTPPGEAPSAWVPQDAPPTSGPGPLVCLLSLFAGMGTDRVALERIVDGHGYTGRLGPS